MGDPVQRGAGSSFRVGGEELLTLFSRLEPSLFRRGHSLFIIGTAYFFEGMTQAQMLKFGFTPTGAKGAGTLLSVSKGRAYTTAATFLQTMATNFRANGSDYISSIRHNLIVSYGASNPDGVSLLTATDLPWTQTVYNHFVLGQASPTVSQRVFPGE
jgi:hypothetical protein